MTRTEKGMGTDGWEQDTTDDKFACQSRYLGVFQVLQFLPGSGGCRFECDGVYAACV